MPIEPSVAVEREIERIVTTSLLKAHQTREHALDCLVAVYAELIAEDFAEGRHVDEGRVDRFLYARAQRDECRAESSAAFLAESAG